MDNSIVRRGTSTVHHHLRGRLLATEGTVTGRIAESYAAVLADCVHATAHAVLATTSNSPALETFHAMALSAAQYQFQDLMGWKQHADNTEAVTQAVEDVVALSSTLRWVMRLVVPLPS
jgi:geranylgeranyl pyrophosphate synthase